MFFIARVPRIKFRYLSALPRNHTWAMLVCCRRTVEIELAGEGEHIFLLQGEDSGLQEEGRGGELKKSSKKRTKKITFVAHSFTFKRPFELFLIPKFFLTGRV